MEAMPTSEGTPGVPGKRHRLSGRSFSFKGEIHGVFGGIEAFRGADLDNDKDDWSTEEKLKLSVEDTEPEEFYDE